MQGEVVLDEQGIPLCPVCPFCREKMVTWYAPLADGRLIKVWLCDCSRDTK